MSEDQSSAIIQAYSEWFGEPSAVVHFDIKVPPLKRVAAVIFLPTEVEQADADANTTTVGTAGLSAIQIVRDFKAEVGMDVKGSLNESDARALAEDLVDLGMAPIKTGRPFEKNQIVRNFDFPIFSRFQLAMLVDWDPIDGFQFPGLDGVSLFMVIPLFESEAKFIESSQDRAEGYLRLYNRGLRPEDPERSPVV